MLLIKGMVCAAIVCFCAAMGYLAAGRFRARKKFFEQLHAFNERYLNELGYARRPLRQFVAAYVYAGDFNKYLQRFLSDRTADCTFRYLTSEERAACKDYFAMLGRGDAHAQSGYFGARRVVLEEKSAVCTRDAKARGELYCKLGLLAGFAIVILIV